MYIYIYIYICIYTSIDQSINYTYTYTYIYIYISGGGGHHGGRRPRRHVHEHRAEGLRACYYFILKLLSVIVNLLLIVIQLSLPYCISNYVLLICYSPSRGPARSTSTRAPRRTRCATGGGSPFIICIHNLSLSLSAHIYIYIYLSLSIYIYIYVY